MLTVVCELHEWICASLGGQNMLLAQESAVAWQGGGMALVPDVSGLLRLPLATPTVWPGACFWLGTLLRLGAGLVMAPS